MSARQALRIGLLAHRYPPAIGGAEMYTATLATALAARGHRVTVFTSTREDRAAPRPGADTAADPAREATERGVFVREFSPVSPPHSGYVAWPGALLPSALVQLGSQDVLHAVGYSSFGTVLGAAVSAAAGTPLVCTALYHPPQANPRPALNALYDRSVGRLIAQRAEAIMFHSQVETDAFEAHVCRLPAGKRHRISSGSFLADVAPGGDFRARIGAGGAPLAAYVGRIDSHKGVEQLLEAFQGVAIPDARLALVGPWERWHTVSPAFTQLVQQLGPRLIPVGPLNVADLAAAYASADVLVVPSRYESFGLVVVEALASGTPVVATRTGIAPEVVRDGHNGFLYDFGDVNALRRALTSALERRGTMREAAQASAAPFTWPRAVEATLAVYREVSQRGRERPVRGGVRGGAA